MKTDLKMAEEFGSDFLADGVVANSFRATQIESVWNQVELFTFNFEGVRNVTDSFVHALFGNLAEDHGRELLVKVRFSGCSELVASMIKTAVGEGFRRRDRSGC